MIMMNAWHVYRSAGAKAIEERGGVHALTGWNDIVFTDSGGYQVFSLRDNVTLDDGGVSFASPSGEELLTPEDVVRIQKRVGADIITALDDCAPYPCTRRRAEAAVRRTTLWARRCARTHRETPGVYDYDQQLWGIVQGGAFQDLRAKSVDEVAALHFDGYGIGGLSIGLPRVMIRDLTALVCDRLPSDRPRHLLGVGLPSDIIDGVDDGADTFDCVLPIRQAQRGIAFTSRGDVSYAVPHDEAGDVPLDAHCTCDTCRTHSRELLARLYHNDRRLAARLVAIHNLSFYHNLLAGAREAIRNGRFASYRNDFLSKWFETGIASVPKAMAAGSRREQGISSDSRTAPETHARARQDQDVLEKTMPEESKEVSSPTLDAAHPGRDQATGNGVGIVHVKVNPNNLIVTITGTHGNALSSSTPGRIGFKGSRRSTASAARAAGEAAARDAVSKGIRMATAVTRGDGPLYDAVIDGVRAGGIEITSIKAISGARLELRDSDKRRR
jgi:queuine tRNA-ribosyltransferase